MASTKAKVNGEWVDISTKGDTGATGAKGDTGPAGADGKDANIVIDSEFSDTSENPVQNKVITAAMAQAAQTLGELASGLEQGEQAIQLLATKMLPDVTDTDNGKLLQVVDGAWAAVAITNGNEVAY